MEETINFQDFYVPNGIHRLHFRQSCISDGGAAKTKDDSPTIDSIKELGLPSGMVVAAVRRDDITIVPSQDTVLMSGDSLVVAAEGHKENVDIDLKSIILKGQHPYIGRRVRDLDISRQTYIVMIKREGRIITPRGDSRLEEGDELVLYTRKFIPEATTISV